MTALGAGQQVIKYPAFRASGEHGCVLFEMLLDSHVQKLAISSRASLDTKHVSDAAPRI